MALNASAPPAGSYAQARYARGLRLWRSRTRLILVLALGPFVALGLAGLFIDGHIAAWAAGAAFGIGLSVWIALRESPPAYIENWRVGADGERKTEQALRSLGSSTWSAFHDVECSRGNYDHIVVGPAGVLLLETKNLQGIVEIRDGVPRLKRRSDPEADKACSWIRSHALAGAASLKEDIQRLSGERLWVQAVVVLWSDFEQGLYVDERCVFVHGSGLVEWIMGRPEAIDPETAAGLLATVQAIAANGERSSSSPS